jgi:hypothetical protein
VLINPEFSRNAAPRNISILLNERRAKINLLQGALGGGKLVFSEAPAPRKGMAGDGSRADKKRGTETSAADLWRALTDTETTQLGELAQLAQTEGKLHGGSATRAKFLHLFVLKANCFNNFSWSYDSFARS